MKTEAVARAMHQNLIDFQTLSKVTYIKPNIKRGKVRGRPDLVVDINLDQVVLWAFLLSWLSPMGHSTVMHLQIWDGAAFQTSQGFHSNNNNITICLTRTSKVHLITRITWMHLMVRYHSNFSPKWGKWARWCTLNITISACPPHNSPTIPRCMDSHSISRIFSWMVTICSTHK